MGSAVGRTGNMMRFVPIEWITLAALVSLGGICGLFGIYNLIAKDKGDCRRNMEDSCTWHTWKDRVCQACGKRAGVNPSERG